VRSADPTAPITYSLQLNSTVSGVTLTDGSTIHLQAANDGAGNNWILGVVDSGPGQTHAGETAFAIAIDPLTGKVSVVEYLSLHNPVTTDPNDPISIQAGSISAAVTIKDGDGDTNTASADISGKIHFRDDGPTLVGQTSVTANVDEDGLHGPLSTANADGSPALRPGEVTGTDSATATGGAGALKALVDFGAAYNNPYLYRSMVQMGERVGDEMKLARLAECVIEDSLPASADRGAAIAVLGYRVLEAFDGYEALEKLKQDLPDLVVLDVMMPGLDGRNLAEVITRLPLSQPPRIVFWSATAEDQLREIGRQTGLPVFSKATSPTQVVQKLEELIQGKDSRS